MNKLHWPVLVNEQADCSINTAPVRLLPDGPLSDMNSMNLLEHSFTLVINFHSLVKPDWFNIYLRSHVRLPLAERGGEEG